MLLYSILCLTDWGIFERSFKSPHNLKAIALFYAPVDSVLAVLSGRVEEVELEFEVQMLFCVYVSIGVNTFRSLMLYAMINCRLFLSQRETTYHPSSLSRCHLV